MYNKLIIAATLLLTMQTATSQVDSAALARADTSGFSINKDAGWNLYNSYVAARGSDSAILEVILLHENLVNWQEEHHIGRIKKDICRPTGDRVFTVDLIVRTFIVRITSDGRSYLRLSSGTPPTESLVVIPLQGVYKIN